MSKIMIMRTIAMYLMAADENRGPICFNHCAGFE